MLNSDFGFRKRWMKTESRAITWRSMALFAVMVAMVGIGSYLLWSYSHPPCSGYPPGGNCPGNYDYTFRISINYTGPWQMTYYGYHGVGALCDPRGVTVNYTGGSFQGTGSIEKRITLSGPNFTGLSLYANAQKLDSSSSLMVVSVESSSNETSLPYGQASLCLGVAP